MNYNCKCTNIQCSRHGNCNKCREHHLTKDNPPYCKRDNEDK